MSILDWRERMKQELREFIDALTDQFSGTMTPKEILDESMDILLEELEEPTKNEDQFRKPAREDPAWAFQVELIVSEVRREYLAKYEQ